MKNVFIIHTHWFNRGDEAANRALIDRLLEQDDVNVTLQINATNLTETDKFQKQGVNLLQERYPRSRDVIEILLMIISKGKIVYSVNGKRFRDAMRNADYVIHAPGGPSIGDIYKKAERPYLLRLLLAKRMEKPYMFYAPSMGPFESPVRNIIRKYVLKNASKIVFRENISAEYFRKLLPNKTYEVTVDSALQNDIDRKEQERIIKEDIDLCYFLNKYDKVIGITITDLQWNPQYHNNESVKNNINCAFNGFIEFLQKENYGVLFIPQLFGKGNDYDYMNSFSGENTYIIPNTYDCYFQQYLISKLHAVVGMRYHSNIFSCKMQVPFISISYEQKMSGFMNSQNLNQYCIEINSLSENELKEKFNDLESNYDKYKEYLKTVNEGLKKLSGRTTQILLKDMEACIHDSDS